MSLLTSILAFGAFLTRAKPIEPEALSNDDLDQAAIIIDIKLEREQLQSRIAELKEELRICKAARDAARADRDQSDAQLRKREHRIAELTAEWNHNIARIGQMAAYIEAVNRERIDLIAARDAARAEIGFNPSVYGISPAVQLTADQASRLNLQIGGLAVIDTVRNPAHSDWRGAISAAAAASSGAAAMEWCNCVPARHDMLLPR
jgi:hypothetical protein